MLLGCCHCGPLDSVSSVFASYSSISDSSGDSNDTGSGCFCVGSISSNTWRMDIDYGWNATTGANTWCCALYRKQKSYILRRVPGSTAGVCYWISDEFAGTTPDNDPMLCLTDTSRRRAWMAIHSRSNGLFNGYFPNQWAMSAGLQYKPANLSNAITLPYVYINPANPPWGHAVDGQPINCLTAYTLTHYTAVAAPNLRRWYGAQGGPFGVTQFPCGTGFGTLCNDLAPPTITVTPVNT